MKRDLKDILSETLRDAALSYVTKNAKAIEAAIEYEVMKAVEDFDFEDLLEDAVESFVTDNIPDIGEFAEETLRDVIASEIALPF